MKQCALYKNGADNFLLPFLPEAPMMPPTFLTAARW
jgi:hypothetical protein